MRVSKKLTIKELPAALRCAIQDYTDSHMDEQGFFAVDEVILIGRRLPHSEADHPHDDATGFTLPAPGVIPNIDPWRGYPKDAA